MLRELFKFVTVIMSLPPLLEKAQSGHLPLFVVWSQSALARNASDVPGMVGRFSTHFIVVKSKPSFESNAKVSLSVNRVVRNNGFKLGAYLLQLKRNYRERMSVG